MYNINEIDKIKEIIVVNERIDFNSPKIVFRKWSDYFLNTEEDDIDDDDDDDGYEDEDYGPVAILKTLNVGAIPSVGDINKLFNLWVCSTNFVITNQMIRELDNTLGIESLDQLSPYKLRVGIGHLFNENEIRLEISKILKQCLEQ